MLQLHKVELGHILRRTNLRKPLLTQSNIIELVAAPDTSTDAGHEGFHKRLCAPRDWSHIGLRLLTE